MQSTQDRFKSTTLHLASFIKNESLKLNRTGIETVDPNMIELVIGILNGLDSTTIIEKFIEKSFETEFESDVYFWDCVKNRDENRIVDGLCNVFGDLPFFRNLKTFFSMKLEDGTDLIKKETKNEFYKILDILIKIAVRHVHDVRSPYSLLQEEIEVPFYEKEFFEQIDLIKYSKLYNFGLKFPLIVV